MPSLLLIATHLTFTLSAPTPIFESVTSTAESIIDTKSSTLEKSPTTKDYDAVTTVTASILKIPNENLIGTSRLPEVTSSAPTQFKDNEMIKIHESTTTRVPSTSTDAEMSSVTATTVELPISSDKSINSDFSTAPNVQSTIDMPINEIDGHGKSKKTKFKDTKKKTLNDAKIVGKSWMQKKQQKMDINYSTTDGSETATAYSTSIKTAPTTIKSTTLTSTLETKTEAVTTELPIPVTLNANEMKTSVAADVHADTNNNDNKDNVIVLNSNSSGLIVVDVMESFGNENSTNSFEIKMDLIDDGNSSSQTAPIDNKDEIFTVSTTSIASQMEKSENISSPTSTASSNDDIILVNSESTASHGIKWNEVKHNEGNGDIKITFDNIDLPHQNVNVSIENGELIIDSIDISVLNRAEEELRKKMANVTETTNASGNKTDSLEIVLIEEDVTTTTSSLRTTSDAEDESHPATIHFEVPSMMHSNNNNNNKMSSSGSGDDIKIKTTDKDSDTIFYISNTEVKLIESIPTLSPNDTQERKKYPAIYEEDVIVDVPSTTVILRNNFTLNESPIRQPIIDKYEEDIVLSPLTSDFDPKDINYIGEAFLDVEESANTAGENHHIIPLTSDVVVQPVELKDMPSINIPIIGEPPQIELAEMMFSDDYENGNNKQSNFRVEEFSPFFINNRLVKNELQADEPRDLETSNGTLLLSSLNRTHSISVNTVINGTNMTTTISPYSNVTAAIVLDSEDIDSSGLYGFLASCSTTAVTSIKLQFVPVTFFLCLSLELVNF